MTNDSEPSTSSQHRTPKTASSTDHDSQWRDTIDDWDAVLAGDDPSPEQDASERAPSSDTDPETETMTPTWETNPQTPLDAGSTPHPDDTPTSAADRGTEASDATASRNSTSAETASASETAERTSTEAETGGQLANGHPIDRIEPLSNSLLKSIVRVLPAPWLADTDVQHLVQWVVYTYVHDTDPTISTADRVETAIDRAAAETDTSVRTIEQLCTDSLYRGQSGTPTENLYSDLETIHRQFSESSSTVSR